MWPKAIAQLIELTPHVVRLLPMADRFFQSKSAEQDAARTAMEQMADGLRGDLGQVTASHAGLYRQLNDQSEKLSNLSADLRSTRATVDSADARLVSVEQKLSLFRSLLAAALVLLVVLVALVIALLLRH
jgi:septal ring factor EnvC (AmiA/AmiB activator)